MKETHPRINVSMQDFYKEIIKNLKNVVKLEFLTSYPNLP